MDFLAQDMDTHAAGTEMRQFSLGGGVGKQTIIDIVSTKYNNMYFRFEPGVCVCKMESQYFGGLFRDYK